MELFTKKNSLVLSSLLISVILISISPNLIASFSLFPLIIYILFNIKILSLNLFKNKIFYFLFILICLSFITSFILNYNNDLFIKSIKVFLLISPILMTFYLLKDSKTNFLNKNTTSLIFIVFFIAATLCLLQIFTGDLIRNLSKGTPTSITTFAAKSNNFMNAFVIFIWFYLAIINSTKNKIYYFPILIIVVAIFSGFSETAKTSLILSTLTFFLYFLLKERICLIIKTVIISSIICFFILPGLIIDNKDEKHISMLVNNLNTSALHRIDIWDRSAELIREQPFFGHATSNAASLTPSNKSIFFDKSINRNHFLYPHNVFLQITLELGLAGLCWLILLLNFFISAISKIDKNIQPYVYAMFVAVITVWIFGIPLYRSWWLVYLGLLSTLIKILSDNLHSDDNT